jgi:uncharacterized protein (DUF779 family)
MCFQAGEFIVGDVDLLLGEIEGCPFYIDFRLYEAWNEAELILDVAPGDPEEFSLGPGDGTHFVVRSGICALPDQLAEHRATDNQQAISGLEEVP